MDDDLLKLLFILISNCPKFGEESLYCCPCLWYFPMILLSIYLFFCFLTQRCSGLTLFFPCPRPGSSHFSQEPWFLLVESGFLETKIWVLGVIIAIIPRSLSHFLSLSPYTHIYISLFTSQTVCIDTHKFYRYLQL